MDLEQYAQVIIDFVRSHQAWAAPIVFALAFGESLAFVSLILPAWAALVGIGASIGPGGLDFVSIWVAGAVGAALGDWLSYWFAPSSRRRSPACGRCRGIPSCCRAAGVHCQVGRVGDLHRAVFRAIACLGSDRRRHFRHALLAIPDCEFLLRLPMGGNPVATRRRDQQGLDLAVEPDRRIARVSAALVTRRQCTR